MVEKLITSQLCHVDPPGSGVALQNGETMLEKIFHHTIKRTVEGYDFSDKH